MLETSGSSSYESLFSSSVAFLIISVAPQMPHLFNADISRGTGKNQLEAGQ